MSLDAEQAQPGVGDRAGRRALAVTAVALAATLALAACGGSAPLSSASSTASASTVAIQVAPAPAAQTLTETGSSLMAPLFKLWRPAYHTQFSQVTLKIATSSSGQGIQSAAAGTTDIGASDAYLSPADLTKHTSLVNIPLAVAALMVIYHVPGVSSSTHLELDGTVLAKIYYGKITSWDDSAIRTLNPGVNLPTATIVPVHRSDVSGSTFLFTSYMSAQDSADWDSSLIGTKVAWPGQPAVQYGENGSEDIIKKVKSTPDSISYVGISYLDEVTADLEGEAQLGNSSGHYLLPTATTIQAGLASFTNTPDNETISLVNGSGAQAYPIINYEYAVVNTVQGSATRARDLQAFLHWAITSGTAQLTTVHFQPLPSSVVTLSDAQIAKIKG